MNVNSVFTLVNTFVIIPLEPLPVHARLDLSYQQMEFIAQVIIDIQWNQTTMNKGHLTYKIQGTLFLSIIFILYSVE